MRYVLGMTLQELSAAVTESGLPTFRARQIYDGALKNVAISDMTTLSKDLRARLSEEYVANSVRVVEQVVSRIDGTKKLLFGLSDGNMVEGVLMHYKYGYTLCLSTQVGCRMNCAFCASGIGGLIRNLTAEEMVGEVVAASATVSDPTKPRNVTNLVLMGTGEPLDNYDNVIRFLRLITDKDGLDFSPRNISLSTCGLVPYIDRLAEEDMAINLTISLHNPFTEERKQIMPVTNSYSVEEVVEASRRYFDKTGRRVYFEYCMIKGENDTLRHATKIATLLKGFPTHVNLIRLNYVEEKGLKGTDSMDIETFLKALNERGVSATLRRSMGSDIDGACGQLRRKYTGGAV